MQGIAVIVLVKGASMYDITGKCLRNNIKATFKDPLAGNQRFAPDGADGLGLLLGGVPLMRSCEGANKHR